MTTVVMINTIVIITTIMIIVIISIVIKKHVNYERKCLTIFETSTEYCTSEKYDDFVNSTNYLVPATLNFSNNNIWQIINEMISQSN